MGSGREMVGVVLCPMWGKSAMPLQRGEMKTLAWPPAPSLNLDTTSIQQDRDDPSIPYPSISRMKLVMNKYV